MPFIVRAAIAAIAILTMSHGDEESHAATGFGFAPLQVPSGGVDEYDSNLCARLGGQPSHNNSICSGLDENDTFCLIGSPSALPCKGLFDHVIQCNRQFNRPALNPFLCASACPRADAPQQNRARGAKCEREIDAAEILPSGSQTTLIYAAEGLQGAAHTTKVSVSAGYTLLYSPSEKNDNLARATSETPGNIELTLSSALGRATLTAMAAATILCADCYPSAATFAAVFAPVLRPVQPVFFAVTGENIAGLTLAKPAPPWDNGRFALSEALLLPDKISDANNWGISLNAESGTVSGRLAMGEYLLLADYSANPNNPFLGPMRMSLTVIAEGEDRFPFDPDAAFPARIATIFVVQGFSDVSVGLHDFSPTPGYDAIFSQPDSGDFVVNQSVARLPLGESVVAPRSIVATAILVGCPPNVECAHRPTVGLSLFAEVVSPPEQESLTVAHAQPFDFTLQAPDNVSGGFVGRTNSEHFTLIAGDAPRLTLNADNPPPAGVHDVEVGLTSAGGFFIGTLLLTVIASVARADLPEAEWGLRAEDRSPTVRVVAGYLGEVYRARSRGILGMIVPPTISGSVFAWSAEGNELAVLLTTALEAESGAKRATAALTILHGERPLDYVSLAQTMEIAVTAFPPPPPVEKGALAPFSGTVFHFGSADYEGGFYAGARFADAVRSSLLYAEPDGRVLTRGVLPPGVYAHTALASGADFVGTVMMTASLVLTPPDGTLTGPEFVAPLADYAGDLFRVTTSVVFGAAELSLLPSDSPLSLSADGMVSVPDSIQEDARRTLLATVRAVFSYDGAVINTARYSFAQTVLALRATVSLLVNPEDNNTVAHVLESEFLSVSFSGMGRLGAASVSVGPDGSVRFHGGTIYAGGTLNPTLPAGQIRMTALALAPDFVGVLRYPLRVRNSCTPPIDEESGERIVHGTDTERGVELFRQMFDAYNRGEVERLCGILEMGADANANRIATNFSVLGEPFLGGDVVAGALEGLDKMFLAGADLDRETEQGGGDPAWHYRLIHLAADNGNPELAAYLIDRNVRMNLRGSDGLTPLMYAAAERESARSDRAFELILAASADAINHVRIEHPVLSFVGSGLANIPCRADKQCSGRTALHQAVIQDRNSRILPLLAAGAHADEVDLTNRSALSYAAAAGGEVELVSIMLSVTSRGIKNLSDDMGFRPLHRAAYGRGVGNVSLMLEDEEVVNTHTTRQASSLLFEPPGSSSLERWMIPHGSTAHDFVPCLGRMSDLMREFNIPRLTTEEPEWENCPGWR